MYAEALFPLSVYLSALLPPYPSLDLPTFIICMYTEALSIHHLNVYWSPFSSLNVYWSPFVSLNVYWSPFFSLNVYWSPFPVYREAVRQKGLRKRGFSTKKGASVRKRSFSTEEGLQYGRGASVRKRGFSTEKGLQYGKGASVRKRGFSTEEGLQYGRGASVHIRLPFCRTASLSFARST